ncbi:hypothetical protein CDAR_394101 [Caerostris darwini]|uniref:Uncharacterized protein n=1 Tax=Caerostris darwini TaxID=1538125 RepID=A0AAV4RIN0_9ARAC|nr:hypothetical protein CDAR_394101 [Caerostris darwini]
MWAKVGRPPHHHDRDISCCCPGICIMHMAGASKAPSIFASPSLVQETARRCLSMNRKCGTTPTNALCESLYPLPTPYTSPSSNTLSPFLLFLDLPPLR